MLKHNTLEYVRILQKIGYVWYTYGRTLQNAASEFNVKFMLSAAAAAINNFTCRALPQFAVCTVC